jgi:hypothetical protein
MSYMNGHLTNVLTREALPKRRGTPSHSRSVPHNALIRDLTRDTINCALAHWYLLPGLELQRYRLRLAFSLSRTPEAARREFSRLPATLYLDAGFALKSLRAQARIGSYLDVSSPWLLPLYVSTELRPDRSLFLNASGTIHRLFARLANRTEDNGTALVTKDLGQLSRLSESFDTITCLARLSRNQKETAQLITMWNALNPGGTLILSVTCTGAEHRTVADFNGRADGGFQSSAIRPYDGELLKSRLFKILGEPKSYAIYGEEAVDVNSDVPDCRSASLRDASWRESVLVSKFWRRCSSISQLRGNGILVMKFIKPDSPSVDHQVRGGCVLTF